MSLMHCKKFWKWLCTWNTRS